MRLVKLSELRVHGLVMTAQESVAVVHEVCRMMHEAAQQDRPIAAPTLAELYVDETGGLIIEPVHPSAAGGDSMALLLDELLPAHLDDVRPGPPAGTAYLAGETSGARERAVLRALYRRVSAAVMAPAFEPESEPAADHAPASPLPIDDSLEWLDTGADPLPAPRAARAADPPPASQPPASAIAMDDALEWLDTEADAAPAAAPAPAVPPPEPPAPTPDFEPEIAFEPIVAAQAPAARGRARPGWQRRVVVWGLAIDAALAVIVGVQLGLIPGWHELVDRATIQADAGERPEPAEPTPPLVPSRRDDTRSVQQLPSASSLMTPATAKDEVAGTGARRGVLISASAPTAVSMPTLIAGADHTSPSPDGRHLAFDLDRDGVRGVFIADRDGGNVSLASGDGRAAAPSWSPDARYLAFVRAEPDRPRVWNLWMREIATGALMRLTTYHTGMVRGASWFPDGRRICFAHQQTLVLLDVRSRRLQTVQSPIASGLIRTPTVSPDGRRVAFEIEGSGIWIMDVRGREMEQIIDDPTPSSLAWRAEADGLTYFSVGAREWRTWRPAPRS